MDASYIKYGIQETSDRIPDVQLGAERHLPVQEQTRREDEDIDLGGEAFWHSQVIQNNEATDGALNKQTNINYSVQESGHQKEHGLVQEEARSEDIALGEDVLQSDSQTDQSPGNDRSN
ncbi:unnamed protein product [Lymnaea stagnalis]|uniref:Uncharacterized protein n=1 Tax=Lymnaea stagnalis TaxID=6523 RepID=A0AAV2HMW9_LYMST